MAAMPENDDIFEKAVGGASEALSQDALDALIAAADLEGAKMQDDTWANDFAGEESDAGIADADFGGMMNPAATETVFGSPSGIIDLPSFDTAAGSGAADSGASDGLGRVRDIPLEITVELGRTKLLIRDILDLTSGSIIELDKIAGEPVDLFANGILIGRGEVIIIDDNFGVRVTELITAADRHQIKESDAIAA